MFQLFFKYKLVKNKWNILLIDKPLLLSVQCFTKKAHAYEPDEFTPLKIHFHRSDSGIQCRIEIRLLNIDYDFTYVHVLWCDGRHLENGSAERVEIPGE